MKIFTTRLSRMPRGNVSSKDINPIKVRSRGRIGTPKGKVDVNIVERITLPIYATQSPVDASSVASQTNNRNQGNRLPQQNCCRTLCAAPDSSSSGECPGVHGIEILNSFGVAGLLPAAAAAAAAAQVSAPDPGGPAVRTFMLDRRACVFLDDFLIT